MQTEFKPGDQVFVVRGHADARLLKQDAVYEIAIIVNSGSDYTHKYGVEEVSGVILRPTPGQPYYPYLWDFNRFVLAK